MSKLFQFILIISTIASVVLNVVFLFSQSIRLDEAQSIWVSTKSIPSIMKINGQDVQVPLYTLILHIWMQLFGTDIITARLLSFLFFLITIPNLYKLIKLVSNPHTATLGVILYLLSPFLVWYSQEARTYSLLTLITTINHLKFLEFIRSEGKSAKFKYFLSSLVGIYTHYFFIFILFSQAVYILIKLLNHKIDRKLFVKYILNTALVGLFFLPWAIYVYSLGLAANTQPLIPPPTSFNLIQVYLNFLVGFQTQFVQSLAISLWPLLIMILLFVFSRKLKITLESVDYFVITSFLPVILVYIISFYKPIFLPRYLIIVVPSLFTLIAWILVNFGRRVLSGVTGTLLLLMLVSLNYQNNSNLTPVKEDFKQTVEYLESNATSRDLVAVSAPFTVYPIEYYYRGLARIDTIPHWDRYQADASIPRFSPSSLEQQILSYTTVYNRLFTVLSYDQGYQTEIVDYLDNHYQLLDSKNYPSNILVRVYKLRYD